MLGGPTGPYGISNWPFRLAPPPIPKRPPAPTRLLPDSPCVISTVLHRPSLIAAAAWRTCSMNEQPPTDVPSAYVGLMPRYQASSVGLFPAVAAPSMSDGFRPPSAMACSAASACRPITDMSGMTPIWVVSAAPTTATDFGFICALPTWPARRGAG